MNPTITQKTIKDWFMIEQQMGATSHLLAMVKWVLTG